MRILLHAGDMAVTRKAADTGLSDDMATDPSHIVRMGRELVEVVQEPCESVSRSKCW